MVRRLLMKLRPLGDRVLIRLVEEEERVGSIIVPDTAKEKPTQGIVEAVGQGKIMEKGDRQPMSVKPGDRILFGRYAGTEIKIEGKEYTVLHQTEILAVL
jgi:chaperonin GroES